MSQNKSYSDNNNYFFLYLILGSIGLLTPFAIDMYLPAMPTIAKDLMVNNGAVQGTLTAYTAGFAIGQLLHGPLSDSYGRRPVLMIGIIFFAITSVICAITTSIEALLYMRFAQGFAGAAAAVIVQAIVRDMFNKEDFARAMSFITLVITISPLLAPLIGGNLAVWLGWRSIFAALALVSVIVLIAVILKIPETLSTENKQPLRFRTTIKNYYRLFTNPVSFGLIFCGAFSFAGMFAFITAGSFVYIDIYGVKPEHFGYLFALNVIGMVLMTSFNGKAVRKMGSHWMLRFGLGCQTLAGVALLVSWLFDFGLWAVVVSVILFVGTISIIGSNSMGLLLSSYPQMAGTASSLAGTLRFGTGAIVSAIIAFLPSGYVWPMVISMFLCSMLSVSAYWLLSRNA
ncbi:Bcr/CflA family multidrug efflux MFS transporter [Vibrio casei]|uniref:Bcr/CflA family efflux transporter n=1 Tax=Vibrio casei TaxID=673372 RepID=A0A368LMJ8_9VIBR|nr:Bcr/CflA family multidrug efflux MFS transporter [Vibrio casei]RCS73102.1 Bcr/CflA family drug resistance efflux transporter [Vibrio casei]SJN40845.1 MFS family multidrug transport protein, bicyclomycin resistance protein [Vibrio casei]